MLALTLAAALLAAAGHTYVDPSHRFAFDVPAGCHIAAASGTTPEFVDCGKGYARVAFAPGGTDRPALQRLVNTIVSAWNDLKLLENHPAGTLGGVPSRMIFVEGVEPGGNKADIEILAAVHDGGWYALVLASPTDEWITDGLKYFVPIKKSFRFTSTH